MTAQEFYDWRMSMGWTQKEAATKLGCAKNTISNYERDESPISEKTRLATEHLTSLAAA